LAWEPEKQPEPPPDEPKELFTEWERQQIMDQVSMSIHKSVEEYFANSNNKTLEDDEVLEPLKLPWYAPIMRLF
jgi:hypothetical protein